MDAEVLAKRPSIAVVVPTLNEEARIGRLLESLQADRALAEIVVSDGGSDDATTDIVRAHPQVRLVEGPRGRAAQLNAGAAAATADVLLFLHADAKLPPDAASLIGAAMQSGGYVGGAFRIRTICDAEPNWAARFLFLADIRSTYTKLPYGDQAIFVRRDVFEDLGGFPEQPLMEDLEFSMRLRKKGRLLKMPQKVEVSGRRFLARPFFYTTLVNVFPLLYRMGVPPRTLKQLYEDIR